MAFSKSTEFKSDQARLARFAKALAHPARIAILKTLSERDSCVVGEIVEVLPLAQSTVSQHLHELKETGLIKGEIDGPKSCYCVNRDALAEFSGLIHQLMKDLKSEDRRRRCCK